MNRVNVGMHQGQGGGGVIHIILKTIVGSHAHGLATPESDIDYRGVFVVPTDELLKLNGDRQRTNWQEGAEDETSWEIGHFLSLSTKSNPTILETYLAPKVETPTTFIPDWGDRVRELFPHVWSSRAVRDAFIGYGLNQRKKFLDNKDNRRAKYAAAYLRTLYNGYELLRTGAFTVKIVDTPVGIWVKKFKQGDFSVGEVVDICETWQHKVDEAYQACPEKRPNIDRVDAFLLDIRKQFWVTK